MILLSELPLLVATFFVIAANGFSANKVIVYDTENNPVGYIEEEDFKYHLKMFHYSPVKSLQIETQEISNLNEDLVTDANEGPMHEDTENYEMGRNFASNVLFVQSPDAYYQFVNQNQITEFEVNPDQAMVSRKEKLLEREKRQIIDTPLLQNNEPRQSYSKSLYGIKHRSNVGPSYFPYTGNLWDGRSNFAGASQRRAKRNVNEDEDLQDQDLEDESELTSFDVIDVNEDYEEVTVDLENDLEELQPQLPNGMQDSERESLQLPTTKPGGSHSSGTYNSTKASNDFKNAGEFPQASTNPVDNSTLTQGSRQGRGENLAEDRAGRFDDQAHVVNQNYVPPIRHTVIARPYPNHLPSIDADFPGKNRLVRPILRLCQTRLRSGAFGSQLTGGRSYKGSWQLPRIDAKSRRYTWLEARNECRRFCMETISIETELKNFVVKSIMEGENMTSLWTSGRRCDTRSVKCSRDLAFRPYIVNGWYWSGPDIKIYPTNKKPPPFAAQPWSSTGRNNWPQPDNSEYQAENVVEESCLAVLDNYYDDGIKWHDLTCDLKLPFICEDNEQLLRMMERRHGVIIPRR